MVNSLNQITTNQAKLTTLDPSISCILAAIDIGTNSVHMVVVRIDPSLPSFSIIAREKDTVRLGERGPDGKLTPEAMERAIAALKRCKDRALSLNANPVIAVATSATREAPNGQKFLQDVRAEVGLSVNLISGQEEARRIYLGVLSGMDFQSQPHVIIDIGGGSTELILGDSQEPRFLSSTKVGAVRLTQSWIASDPIDPTEFTVLKAYVRGMLERPIEEMRLYIKPDEELRLVGTSGTIETLAIINALEKYGEVPSPLNGYQLTRKDIKEYVKRFSTLNYEQRMAIPGMSDKRAEIILAGSVVLLEAMTQLNLDKITLCERALREGMIVDWMLTHGYIEDRLKYQSEIRERSVIKIAKKYGVNLESSQRIAQFAQILFQQTQNVLHFCTDEEWKYLWTAAILHNCGTYVNHSAHHKHSYYLIRNSEILGFTEIELEIIANLARYYRKSKPKKKHEEYIRLPEQYQLTVRQLSAILRLATALDRRQIGAISHLECKYDPEYRTLHLHLFPANPEDDCDLEMWGFDYEKPIFEEEFGIRVVTTLAFFPTGVFH